MYTFSKNDVSPKTLLCFKVKVRVTVKVRVRTGVSGNTFSFKRVFEQFVVLLIFGFMIFQ